MMISAMIVGEIFQRLKLPALVGQIIAGIVIGPSLLNVVQPSDSLKVITDLGVFFLMFMAGLEIKPDEIKKAGKSALLISSIAFIVPFVGGVVAGNFLGLSMITSLFVGLALSITAVPVTAIVLMEFGLMKSKMGSTIMTAAIIDDILSLIVLGIVLQMAASGTQEINYSSVGFSVLKIVTFLGGILLFDLLLKKTKYRLPSQVSYRLGKLKTREIGFGILLISAFTLAVTSEMMGLHFIIGTFFAGLIIYREVIGKENFEKVRDVFSAICFGLLAPIFFAYVGTEFNLQSIGKVLPLFAILLAVAISGKIGGGFVASKLAGFSNSESKVIAYLMNNRGLVELIMASIGLQTHLIDITLFTVIVAIGFITTMIAPIMARFALRRTIGSSNMDR
jgi:Kef-type K+ transport system membrane component KefB